MRAGAVVPCLLIALCAPACGGPGETSAEVQARLAAAQRPRVVAVDPPLGARDVDPRRTSLSVTFDRPMDPVGWAWVTEDPATAPELGEAVTWSVDGRTCTVDTVLAPNRHYVLWINSERFDYFKDVSDVSAAPFRWDFSTRFEPDTESPAGIVDEGAAGGRSARLLTLPGESPRVVAFEPGQGATQVPPGLVELRVTFDRPMREGWSWVTEAGKPFPELVGRAFFDPGMQVNVLPVRLEPETTYVIGLNSGPYQDFADAQGRVLEPVRWSFSTGR
jgi:hypothetical protein